MTQSSEMRHIIMFSLPLLAGNLLQQTYNIVDTMVVGRYLGDDALAAVGATGSITYLFYTLCIGLSVGAGIIVAQYFGAGKKKALRSAVFNSALVTAIFGIVISLLSVPATRPILELLKVPDKLIGDSVAYMQIACGGTIAVAAYLSLIHIFKQPTIMHKYKIRFCIINCIYQTSIKYCRAASHIAN